MKAQFWTLLLPSLVSSVATNRKAKAASCCFQLTSVGVSSETDQDNNGALRLSSTFQQGRFCLDKTTQRINDSAGNKCYFSSQTREFTCSEDEKGTARFGITAFSQSTRSYLTYNNGIQQFLACPDDDGSYHVYGTSEIREVGCQTVLLAMDNTTDTCHASDIQTSSFTSYVARSLSSSSVLNTGYPPSVPEVTAEYPEPNPTSSLSSFPFNSTISMSSTRQTRPPVVVITVTVTKTVGPFNTSSIARTTLTTASSSSSLWSNTTTSSTLNSTSIWTSSSISMQPTSSTLNYTSTSTSSSAWMNSTTSSTFNYTSTSASSSSSLPTFTTTSTSTPLTFSSTLTSTISVSITITTSSISNSTSETTSTTASATPFPPPSPPPELPVCEVSSASPSIAPIAVGRPQADNPYVIQNASFSTSISTNDSTIFNYVLPDSFPPSGAEPRYCALQFRLPTCAQLPAGYPCYNFSGLEQEFLAHSGMRFDLSQDSAMGYSNGFVQVYPGESTIISTFECGASAPGSAERRLGWLATSVNSFLLQFLQAGGGEGAAYSNGVGAWIVYCDANDT